MSRLSFGRKLRALSACWLLLLGTGTLSALPSYAEAEGLEAMATEITSALGQEATCGAANSVAVGVYPLDPDDLPITQTAAELLYDDLLGRLLANAPRCAQFIDARGAYVTIEYLTRSSGFEDIAQIQRTQVEQALRDVDYILELTVNPIEAGPALVAALTEMGAARAIRRIEARIPARFTDASCGTGAQPVEVAMRRLAKRLANRTAPIDRLIRAGAWYEDTEQTTALASFLEAQMLDALGRQVENSLTGRQLELVDAQQVSVDGETLALGLRYWPCEDAEAALVSVTLSAASQFHSERGFVRLQGLPSGMEIRPHQPQPPDADISLAPVRATADDQLTLVATPPWGCNPFFFHLSPSDQMTPIPSDYFRRVELGNGRTQFEASPKSEYGLFITAEDEAGQHRIGYLCQPDKLSADLAFRDILRAVRDRTAEEDQGVLGEERAAVFFQVRRFEVYF